LAQFPTYDSCVAIVNVRGFVECLTKALNAYRPVEFLGLAATTYESRTQPWNGEDFGLPSWFVKDPSFQDEKEVRACWLPVTGTGEIEPKILTAEGPIDIFCLKVL
jgi:hypothetical protein